MPPWSQDAWEAHGAKPRSFKSWKSKIHGLLLTDAVDQLEDDAFLEFTAFSSLSPEVNCFARAESLAAPTAEPPRRSADSDLSSASATAAATAAADAAPATHTSPARRSGAVAGRAGQGRAGGCGGGEEARGASADATVDASTDTSAEATVDGLSQGMRKLSVRARAPAPPATRPPPLAAPSGRLGTVSELSRICLGAVAELSRGCLGAVSERPVNCLGAGRGVPVRCPPQVRPLSALLLWRRKSRGSKAAEEPVEGQPVGPKATRGVPITIAQTVARPGAAEAGARKA